MQLIGKLKKWNYLFSNILFSPTVPFYLVLKKEGKYFIVPIHNLYSATIFLKHIAEGKKI